MHHVSALKNRYPPFHMGATLVAAGMMIIGTIGIIGHPEKINKGIGRSGCDSACQKSGERRFDFFTFPFDRSMASSLATRAVTQAVRAASRRAPRILSKAAVKPAQTASYSLLAQAAAARCTQHAAVQVSFVLLASCVLFD